MVFSALAKKGRAAGALTAAFLAISGYAAHNLVSPDQFAIQESFGTIEQKILPSGFYVTTPFVSYTHSYNKNAQIIEFNAGSCRFIPTCDSTSDRNPLTATIALHYEVERDVHKLSFHRWEMDGWYMADGYWLLTSLMNDSANAVLGRRTMNETLQNPSRFLEEFRQDFAFRLDQNNVPVKIGVLELKGFNTLFPSRTPAYEIFPAALRAQRPS